MEWLTQLSAGQVAQGGAVIVIVTAAIAYIVRFQTTFTDRLEAKGLKDEARITELTDENRELQGQIDEERTARRAAEVGADAARHEARTTAGTARREAAAAAAAAIEVETERRRQAESDRARLVYQLHKAGMEPDLVPRGPNPDER